MAVKAILKMKNEDCNDEKINETLKEKCCEFKFALLCLLFKVNFN